MYNCTDFLFKRYHFSHEQAGFLLGISLLIPIILTPILGILADKKGGRSYMVAGGFVVTLITHILFMVLPSGSKGNPVSWAIVGMLGQGLFLSTSPLTISCIEMVVDNRMAGFGFGLVVSV
mmetsp:Transcript_6839/g.6125  ORF Transcript_6839/g.6125 Transcript_6839/m.6125 type:complete len:121 (-) Transcript_6839:389-751(-)